MNLSVLRVFAHIEEDLYRRDETTGLLTGGSPYFVLKDLALMANFTSVSFSGVEWKENLNLTGDPVVDDIVPLLSEGTVDIAGSFYYFTAPRASLLTPLFPCHPEKFNVFFHQPHFTSVRNVFLEPFHPSFAVAHGLLLPLLLLLAFALLRTHSPHLPPSAALKEVSAWILALHLLKTHPFPPNPPSALRTLLLTTSLYFSLLYSIYAAALISALKSNFLVIKAPRDLVTNAFSFYANPALRQTLLNEQIYKPHLNPNMTTLDSINLAVTQRSHVHVDHSNSFLWLAEEMQRSPVELCRLISSLPFGGSPISSGFYVSKGSSLKQLLNPKILRLTELGLISRYKSLYILTNTFVCTKSKEKESLGLRQLNGPFILLLLSTPLVALVFLYEHLHPH